MGSSKLKRDWDARKFGRYIHRILLPKRHLANHSGGTRDKLTMSCKRFVRSVSPEEAQRIFDSPQLRKRVLRSRAAFRDKAKGMGPLKPKCRIVAIGCQDPDLFSLNRDCAIPTRQSEYVLLAFFNKWTLWSGDVKTAFLQGRQEGRSEGSRPPDVLVASLSKAREVAQEKS